MGIVTNGTSIRNGFENNLKPPNKGELKIKWKIKHIAASAEVQLLQLKSGLKRYAHYADLFTGHILIRTNLLDGH